MTLVIDITLYRFVQGITSTNTVSGNEKLRDKLGTRARVDFPKRDMDLLAFPIASNKCCSEVARSNNNCGLLEN